MLLQIFELTSTVQSTNPLPTVDIPCSDCLLRSTSLGSYPLQTMILNWSGELRKAFTASMWDAPSRDTPFTSRIRWPTCSWPSRSAAPPSVICAVIKYGHGSEYVYIYVGMCLCKLDETLMLTSTIDCMVTIDKCTWYQQTPYLWYEYALIINIKRVTLWPLWATSDTDP